MSASMSSSTRRAEARRKNGGHPAAALSKSAEVSTIDPGFLSTQGLGTVLEERPADQIRVAQLEAGKKIRLAVDLMHLHVGQTGGLAPPATSAARSPCPVKAPPASEPSEQPNLRHHMRRRALLCLHRAAKVFALAPPPRASSQAGTPSCQNGSRGHEQWAGLFFL